MTPLITAQDIPYLPRGVRLQDDRVRGIRVLQAPERAMRLDQIGDAILGELDGVRSMEHITRDLAARYDAPVDEIAGDVRDFLTGLIERRMVFLREAA
jgi:pyrroloquinoline quinone biosynthesis protein D